MSVTKIQTETTYNVNFNGQEYEVVHTEDSNLGLQSWDVFNEFGDLLSDDDTLPIVEYTIENMDSGEECAFF